MITVFLLLLTTFTSLVLMGPYRRPVAARAAAEPARNARLVMAATPQNLGRSVRGAAAIRLVTLAFHCRVYHPNRDCRERLGSAGTARLNHQFVDGNFAYLETQLIAASPEGHYGPAWQSSRYMMLFDGHRRTFLYTVLIFMCYLRLLGMHLAAPVSAAGPSYASRGLGLRDIGLGQPPHTGTAGIAVLIDQDSGTLPVLAEPLAATSPDASPGDVGATEHRQNFTAAADLLGLKAPVEHMLTGPPFGRVLARVRALARPGPSAAATFAAGRKRWPRAA